MSNIDTIVNMKCSAGELQAGMPPCQVPPKSMQFTKIFEQNAFIVRWTVKMNIEGEMYARAFMRLKYII